MKGEERAMCENMEQAVKRLRGGVWDGRAWRWWWILESMQDGEEINVERRGS